MYRKIYSIIFIIVMFNISLFAALHPSVQAKKDAKVLDAFVATHEKVNSTLRYVDYKRFKIYFDKNCTISFKRAKVNRPEGWKGPAPKLIYEYSTCNTGAYDPSKKPIDPFMKTFNSLGKDKDCNESR